VRELSPPRTTSVGMGSLSLSRSRRPGRQEESGRSPGVRGPFAGGRHRRRHLPDRLGRTPRASDPVGGSRPCSGGHAFFSGLTLQGPIGPESGHVPGRAANEATSSHAIGSSSGARGGGGTGACALVLRTALRASQRHGDSPTGFLQTSHVRTTSEGVPRSRRRPRRGAAFTS